MTNLLPELSIDVDAHVQKLAGNTYTSKQHYPVELVRLALSRGADRVELTIAANRLEIVDNGRGIAENEWNLLLQLLDGKQRVSAREQAIGALKSPRGIGLLALFSAAPNCIVLENVHGEKGQTILIDRGTVKETSPVCRIASGTRIVLYRSGGSDREKRIVEDLCKAVEKEIILNGKPIAKSPLLSPYLAAAKLKASGEAAGGMVGIPVKGDLCRVWLLDQGIPWFYRVLPPRHGFVFEAALEYRGAGSDAAHSLSNHLAPALTDLYRRLAEQYAALPPAYRERVEELLFNHNRFTGDASLVNRIAPFQLFNSSLRLNLSQVVEKAKAGSLCAVPAEENASRYRPPAAGAAAALVLTRQQLDFLVNQQRIPIRLLSPGKHRKKRAWVRDFLARIRLAPVSVVDRDDLSHDERSFLSGLSAYLQNLTPLLVKGRSLLPAVSTPPLLLINRQHPLTRRAVAAYRKDNRNIEMLAHLFT